MRKISFRLLPSNKTYNLPAPVTVTLLFLSAIYVFSWIATFIWLSADMLATYSGVPFGLMFVVTILLLGQLDINSVRHALLPAKVQAVLGGCLLPSLIAYQYFVVKASWPLLVFLCSGLIIAGILKSLKREQ